MKQSTTLATTLAIAAACLALSMGGCLGKKPSQKDKKSDDPWAADSSGDSAKGKKSDSPASDDSDDDSAAAGMSFDDIQRILSTFAANLSRPGPYDEPVESAGYAKATPHLGVFELSGEITELESYSMFGRTQGVPLRTLTERLRSWSKDDTLTGLLIRFSGASMSLTVAEELRAALLRFKGEGENKKSLVCHTEDAANVEYYLLSACDRIGLAPTGGIMISGVAAAPVHLKGLLDKFGVQPDFLHVGDFKGAAEPLTRDRPSPEMVKTIQAILDQQFETLVSGIASGRKLDRERVVALIDEAVFQHEDAKDAGLVDEITPFEAFRASAAGTTEWVKVKLEDDSSGPDMAQVMNFLGMGPGNKPLEPHVALVYAVGDIIDGRGDGILGARGQIASRTLAAALRSLAADDNVKAVVLRVSSGGGSALASELIWHATREISSKKPFIVSMGAVAASGGYYISAGAAKIYADETTLTGSIGVVGGKLALGKALAKQGVTSFPMGRGKRAHLFSMMQSWNGEEKATIQSMMEGIYKVFVQRVADGRKKTYNEIHEIAQGRVWTGAAAKENGLVDAIGTVEDALADARERAGLAPDSPLEVYPPEPGLRDFIGMIGEVHAPFGMGTALAALEIELGPKLGAHVVAQLRRLLLLTESPVLAATFLPLFE